MNRIPSLPDSIFPLPFKLITSHSNPISITSNPISALSYYFWSLGMFWCVACHPPSFFELISHCLSSASCRYRYTGNYKVKSWWVLMLLLSRWTQKFHYPANQIVCKMMYSPHCVQLSLSFVFTSLHLLHFSSSFISPSSRVTRCHSESCPSNINTLNHSLTQHTDSATPATSQTDKKIWPTQWTLTQSHTRF